MVLCSGANEDLLRFKITCRCSFGFSVIKGRSFNLGGVYASGLMGQLPVLSSFLLLVGLRILRGRSF